MFDATVQRAINNSVQTADNNKIKPVTATDGAWDMWGVIPHAEIISPWGWRRRDRELRTLSYAVHNGLFQGAIAALIMKVQATPWEVKGGRNLARYYQDMLQASDFHDWETWVARMLWDFLTQDFGAVTEIIGNGSNRLSGRVLGIAHMDSLSCYSTKNNDFPIIYWNEEDNAMHQMHQTFVHRMTDMVSPQRRAYGTGMSALSRYLSDANVDILLGRHDNEMLSDLPPAGLLAVSGMVDQQWSDAVSMFENNRRADGQSVFRSTMVLHAIDPDNPLKIESIPFSTLPQNFDSFKFVEMHVNKLALALGIDPQDIWPLSGQALGTGTQSTILHSKAQGKMFGRILQMITRFINRKVLPDGLEFQFKFKDTEADSERANTAKLWVDMVNSASFLSSEEKRKLIAQEVEPIRDVITDENGEVVALPDDDPKADDQEVIAPDDSPLGAVVDPSAVQANVQGEDNPARPGDDNSPANGAVPAQRKPTFGGKGLLLDRGHDPRVATKDYPDTESSFIESLAVIFGDVESGSINRGSFSIRMRQALNTYGKAAYTDGLEAGGVTGEWEQSDSDAFASILASKSAYVTDAATRLYKDDGTVIGGADYNAALWTVSLKAFYYGGVESADKNGMYTFVGDDGKESCDTCKGLKNKTHRMSWYIKNKLRPGMDEDSDSFDCKGFNCVHFLEKKVA